MLGAIIGDMVGSVYEFDNIKTTDFPLFVRQSNYTDDSVMSFAVADWLLHTNRSDAALTEKLVAWAKNYPCPMGGYGGSFRKWLFNPETLPPYTGERRPYKSFGNGSAMRCSACGWVAKTIDEALDLAKRSAEVTHNHPEGIKGAQATAAAIFMARQGETKEAIRSYIVNTFGYDLTRSCDEIRPSYSFNETCQGTVPEALIAFFESTDFESAIRLGVSLGGDSDTLCCITGGVAEAYYKYIPEHIITEVNQRVPAELLRLIKEVKDYNKEL